VADVLWPWGNHARVQSYEWPSLNNVFFDVSTLGGIQAYCQNLLSIHGETSPGAKYYYPWDYSTSKVAYSYKGDWSNGGGTSTIGSSVGAESFAIGYLLCDYDHLFYSGADLGGASSIYRIATLILTWQNDPVHSGETAFMTAYGHHCFAEPVGGYGVDVRFALDPAANYIDAWLWNLMWSQWYTG